MNNKYQTADLLLKSQNAQQQSSQNELGNSSTVTRKNKKCIDFQVNKELLIALANFNP